MKLVLALAAGAAAFTGPVGRLPTVGVARITKTQQPAMLLGGLRARANNLVPTRRPRRCHQTPAGRLARETPRPLAAQVATRAEAAEVTETEKKGFLGGLDVPLLAYFFFWYLGNYYCPAAASATDFESRGVVSEAARRRRDAPSQTTSRTRRPLRRPVVP